MNRENSPKRGMSYGIAVKRMEWMLVIFFHSWLFELKKCVGHNRNERARISKILKVRPVVNLETTGEKRYAFLANLGGNIVWT